MDRLDAMRIFVRVVETGSFSKAAAAEGIVQSTASKQVAALEKHLGTQLLRRSSHGLNTTATGRAYYESVVKAIITSIPHFDTTWSSTSRPGQLGA